MPSLFSVYPSLSDVLMSFVPVYSCPLPAVLGLSGKLCNSYRSLRLSPCTVCLFCMSTRHSPIFFYRYIVSVYIILSVIFMVFPVFPRCFFLYFCLSVFASSASSVYSSLSSNFLPSVSLLYSVCFLHCFLSFRGSSFHISVRLRSCIILIFCLFVPVK